MRIEFQRVDDPGGERGDLVFHGVPGVRPEIQSGVMSEPADGGGWQLDFSTHRDFTSREDAQAWLDLMARHGFTLEDDNGNRIASVAGVPGDGGYVALESVFCVKPVPSLDAGKQWVQDHTDFLLDAAQLGR